MTVELTPKLDLVIWSLLITGDEPMMSQLKPGITPTERNKLVDAGLIRLEKRGRASYVVLEDKAWDWAAARLQSDNFAVKFPSQATTAIPTFQVLLEKLGIFLRSRHISLAEFLDPPSTLKDDSPEERLRQAYADISQASSGFAVRLAKLRQRLSTMPAAQLDEVLLTMQQGGILSLMPMEDPEEIGSEDEAAAIDMGDGDKRYFVYIKS